MEEKFVRAYHTPERIGVSPSADHRRLYCRLHCRLYCRSARLVIECDGRVHKNQVEYDRERDKIIAAYNLRILRFSNDAIAHNRPVVLSRIIPAAKQSQ